MSSEAVYDLSSGSPIMDAVVRADFEAVRRLAAESSRAGTEKLTPLHAASLNDASQHMVEFLLRAGAPKDIVDDAGFAPLHRMAQFNRIYGATALLAYGAEANKKVRGTDDTPLHIAARAQFEDMAIILLAHGANPNSTNAHGAKPIDEGLSHIFSPREPVDIS